MRRGNRQHHQGFERIQLQTAGVEHCGFDHPVAHFSAETLRIKWRLIAVVVTLPAPAHVVQVEEGCPTALQVMTFVPTFQPLMVNNTRQDGKMLGMSEARWDE